MSRGSHTLVSDEAQSILYGLTEPRALGSQAEAPDSRIKARVYWDNDQYCWNIALKTGEQVATNNWGPGAITDTVDNSGFTLSEATVRAGQLVADGGGGQVEICNKGGVVVGIQNTPRSL